MPVRPVSALVGLMLALAVTASPAPDDAGPQPVGSGPPMPYVDSGACPFEGCVYREWQSGADLVVRTTRAAAASIAFRVRKGEVITALTGVVVTTSPGRVRFRQPVDLTSTEGTIHVEPGETLYLLTYEGEGFTKAWFKGKVYTGLDGSTAFFSDPCTGCAGTIVARPRQVWWVSIRNAKGQVGWTNEPDKFDGKDALGAEAPALDMAERAVSCLSSQSWGVDALREIVPSNAPSLWVRVEEGEIPGTSPQVSRLQIAIYSPDDRKGWLFFARPSGESMVVLRNAYRLA